MKQSIFTVDIYKTLYQDLTSIKRLAESSLIRDLSYSQYINELTPERPVMSANTYSTVDHWKIGKDERLHELDQFKKIVDFIERHAKFYWDRLDYFPEAYPRIIRSWVNRQEQDGFVLSHNHRAFPLAAVFYLDAEEDQGNIVFENPLDLVIGQVAYLNSRKTLQREIKVNTGDLLIFPGWLKHYTLPNKTEKDRLSIAMNLNIVTSTDTLKNEY